MHIVRADQKAKSMPKPRDVKESSQWRRYARRRNIIILYSLSFFNLVLFSLMKGILPFTSNEENPVVAALRRMVIEEV